MNLKPLVIVVHTASGTSVIMSESNLCDNISGDGGPGDYNASLPKPAPTQQYKQNTHLHPFFDSFDLRLVFLCHRLTLCDHSSVVGSLCTALAGEVLFKLRQTAKGARYFLRLACSGQSKMFMLVG